MTQLSVYYQIVANNSQIILHAGKRAIPNISPILIASRRIVKEAENAQFSQFLINNSIHSKALNKEQATELGFLRYFA